MRLCFIGKVGRITIDRYLKPLLVSEQVEKLDVVREDRLDIEDPKLNYHLISKGFLGFQLIKLLFKGKACIKKEQPDYVLTFNPMPWGAIAWLAAKRCKKPIIVGLIGEDYYCHLQSWRAPILLSLLKRSAMITVTGPSWKNSLAQRGIDENKIIVLPHAIDEKHFAHDAPMDQRPIDVICIGRCDERKQFMTVLKAIKICHEKQVTVRTCIIGDGPLLKQMQAYINAQGLDAFVELKGFNTSTAEALKQSKIVLAPSLDEGMPFAVVEGMLAGAVPMVTDCGTIKDWIADHVEGVFVPKRAPEALAQALMELLQDEQRYKALQTASLNRAKQFHLQEAVKTWDEIFKKLDFTK